MMAWYGCLSYRRPTLVCWCAGAGAAFRHGRRHGDENVSCARELKQLGRLLPAAATHIWSGRRWLPRRWDDGYAYA